jgi:LacI family transcriptional regulator
MEHLLGLGHRRIGFIYGVAVREAGLDRLQPYEAALRAAGIAVEPGLVVSCGPSVEEGYRAARELLAGSPRPTAIIAINDLLAVAAIRAAADAGLRVPADISVAGFDDVPLARYYVPRLTTVHREMDRVGGIAVGLLLERIGNPALPARMRHVPSVLQVRESTGPVPS